MEYNLLSLRNQSVLITGGSGAIGQAVAEGFRQNGANVVLWGHRDIAPEIKNRYDYQIVELRKKQEIEKAFSASVAHAGKLDTVVNCAGFTSGMESEQYDFELWKKTLDINLTAPFLLCQMAARHMIANEIPGSIVNITSIGAKQGFPNNPAYGAAKGGLCQLTRALACDWAKYGIRVNNVEPGYTATKMTRKSWNSEDMRAERTKRTMLGRWAMPEDIVGIVLFLASSMSSYITGADFCVDGGWTSKGL